MFLKRLHLETFWQQAGCLGLKSLELLLSWSINWRLKLSRFYSLWHAKLYPFNDISSSWLIFWFLVHFPFDITQHSWLTLEIDFHLCNTQRKNRNIAAQCYWLLLTIHPVDTIIVRSTVQTLCWFGSPVVIRIKL